MNFVIFNMQFTLAELILAGISVLCIILTIIAVAISAANAKRLKRILRYTKRGKLDDTIEEYFDRINETAEEIHEAAEKIDLIEKEFSSAYQQVGIVNFDAYPDLRGSYSFCVALLNRQNNGFVITSLYGHDSSNTYVKTIRDGKADVQLMNEEQEAVNKALNIKNKSEGEE